MSKNFAMKALVPPRNPVSQFDEDKQNNLGQWIVAKEKRDLSPVAREALEERESFSRIRYADYNAPANGAFGMTRVSSKDYSPSDEVLRQAEALLGLFGSDIFTVSQLLNSKFRAEELDPSQIVISEDDLEHRRGVVANLVGLALSRGQVDPYSFSEHAVTKHGAEVVAETCWRVGSSILDGDYKISQKRTTQNLPPRLIVGPSYPTKIAGNLNYTKLLALLVRYDPEALESYRFNLSVEESLFVFALAGISEDDLFRRQKRNNWTLRTSQGFVPFSSVTGHWDMYKTGYCRMLDVTYRDEEYTFAEIYEAFSEALNSTGLTLPNKGLLQDFSENISFAGIRPNIIFSAFPDHPILADFNKINIPRFLGQNTFSLLPTTAYVPVTCNINGNSCSGIKLAKILAEEGLLFEKNPSF